MLALFLSFSVFLSPIYAQETSGNTVGFAQAFEMFLKTPGFKSFDHDIEALKLDFESRDVILQPTFELSGYRTREARELLFRNPGVRPQSELFNMTLAKPFSTGTLLQLSTSLEQAVTPSLPPGNQDIFEWRFTLSQNLWKNSFGAATRLRYEREDYEKKQQFAELLRRQALSLIEFENLYWDWALTIKEAELQEKNLKRSQEILRWVRARYNRAAAEKTDFLNAQALLARRELQVNSIQQRITQALSRVERFIPRTDWRPDVRDLSGSRDTDQLVIPWVEEENSKPVPLEYLSLSNEAEAQKMRAKETRDSIRPELNIEANYGKNAIDPRTGEAINRASIENNEVYSIGLVYRTGLDLSRERKMVRSETKRSEALLERKRALEAEAQIAWDKLKEELKDLDTQIKQAEELVEIQTQRLNAEKDRYLKGRTTAFEAITYEQEVAESEIMLWNLYALKRKTEARARLFAL